MGRTCNEEIGKSAYINSVHGIEIVSNDVAVERLALRNGNLDGIKIGTGATGTRITRVKIVAAGRYCVRPDGADTRRHHRRAGTATG